MDIQATSAPKHRDRDNSVTRLNQAVRNSGPFAPEDEANPVAVIERHVMLGSLGDLDRDKLESVSAKELNRLRPLGKVPKCDPAVHTQRCHADHRVGRSRSSADHHQLAGAACGRHPEEPANVVGILPILEEEDQLARGWKLGFESLAPIAKVSFLSNRLATRHQSMLPNRDRAKLSSMMLAMALAAASVGVAVAIPQHVATTPVHKLGEGWWKTRHEAKVDETKKGGIDLVFIGDSITQGWEGAGKAIWDAEIAPLKAANFGFSGDRTEHVLWRLENGEVTGLKPKLVVIMIGTNNIGHGSSTPAQAADGIQAIVQKLRGALPGTKILILGVFPRGPEANDPMRMKAAEITQRLPGLADGTTVHFLDIGKYFVRPSGSLRNTLMPDYLHLNADGYMIWAKAMMPTVRQLMAN